MGTPELHYHGRMQYRALGDTGLKVPVMGLGGNTFGQTVQGAEAVAVIRAALDAGMTFIDTADVYSLGESERCVAEAIEGRRHEVVLATKGRQAMGEGPYRRGLSRRWIMRAAEDSLRRLRTDYIDLYQVHAPDPETPLEETLRALDDLVRQGKVLYIGCSNYAAWEMTYGYGLSERFGLSRWASAQQRWNLVEGLDDPTLLPACRRLGMGIIPYTPLASGLLTGKYRPGAEAPPGTRFADLARLRGRLSESGLAVVERLRTWAEERGHSVAELAISWLLAHPEVSTVIVGARTAEQARENARLGEWTLTPTEREEVAALAAAPWAS